MQTVKTLFFMGLFVFGLQLIAQPKITKKKGSESMLDEQNFTVTYQFAKTLTTDVPEFKIIFKNQRATPIKLKYLDQPICFVQKYLKFDFMKAPIPFPKMKACTMNEAKASVTQIDQKNEKVLQFSFKDLFEADTLWPTGHYSMNLDWVGENSPDSSTFVHAEWMIGKPLKTFEIKKGEIVELPDGSAFKFTGHSHKRVYEGQTSPLMIYGEYRAPQSKTFKDFNANIYPKDDRHIKFTDDYHGYLEKHDYDHSMQIIYFGEIKN